jgi:hypothetical protein
LFIIIIVIIISVIIIIMTIIIYVIIIRLLYWHIMMDLWDSKALQRIIMDYDGNSEGNSDENDGIMIYIYR